MIFPYLSSFVFVYFLPTEIPIIFVKFYISGLSIIYLLGASLTFKNLPLRGKTPYLSLPTISKPARASDLAESPSVKIIVQDSAYLVPASFASSSFGIPRSLLFFLPGPSYLAIIASSLALATFKIRSTTPESRIPFKNLSDSSTLLPKS